MAAVAAAKLLQSCPTLCDLMDCTVHGILQARILEWVAFPFSKGSSHSGIKPGSPVLQTDSLPAELSGKPYKHVYLCIFYTTLLFSVEYFTYFIIYLIKLS